MSHPVSDERATIRPIPLVSVDAQRAANPPTARQIDSQAPDAGPHGFTTDAGLVPSVPPRRSRRLGHREILAWTVASLTGGVIAATIAVTGIASATSDASTASTGARAVSVAPLPASPTSGLGSRNPPESPATSPSVIPLAALPMADPPRARAAEARPTASTRAKITATAKPRPVAKAKAKAAASATAPARQTSTTASKERAKTGKAQ
jgi:hypothetical protein